MIKRMPRYTYKCRTCDFVFQIVHSIKEKLTDCENCNTTSTLQRIPSMPLILNKKQGEENREVGSFVKEYIENAKDDLREEKKELSNQEYKDD